LTQAVKLPSADSVVWSSLARACRWAGRAKADTSHAAYKTALEKADAELRVNPLNTESRANRAYLLAEMGHAQDALREIAATRLAAGGRGDVTILFNAALIDEWLGDRSAALDMLEQAVRHGYPIGQIKRHPDLSRLRKDPGYQRVLDMAARGPKQRF
jgi:hypothetical protein